MLAALREKADVGVNLLELDEIAHEMIRDRGAESCYIDYHPSFGASPFGKVLCTSVNDAVLHGLPHDYTLVDGDLVSLDFAGSVDGWVADSAVTVIVGTPRAEDLKLIETTEARWPPGSTRPRPGTRSATSPSPSPRSPARPATRSTPTSAGTGSAAPCTVTRTSPTTAAAVAGCRSAGPGDRDRAVVPGDTDKIYTDPDGWTLRSRDGSRGAHSEHTVAITPDGPLVP